MAFETNEHVGNQERILKDAIDGALLGMWVALPCVVTAYDPENVTVEALPTIKSAVQQPDGSIVQIDMPTLLDVPVMFTRGGGCTITHPINIGDECLVIFADRCIDSWWQSGCTNETGKFAPQAPMENRSHDLSDGFAIFAPQSQKKKISNISTTTLQIRSDDGEAFIELDPESHNVNVTTPTEATVTATTVNLTATNINSSGIWNHTGTMAVSDLLTANNGLDVVGDALISGGINATDDVVGAGISLSTHRTSNVQPLVGGIGGPPIP